MNWMGNAVLLYDGGLISSRKDSVNNHLVAKQFIFQHNDI